MYDYVFVTPLPAFYKVNLYNQLAKKLSIYVIFIGNSTREVRSADFADLTAIDFEYSLLYSGDFQSRNKLLNIINIQKILANIHYKKIVVSGWDLVELWFIAFTNNKAKNCLALESTLIESQTSGLLGFIKRVFFKRIGMVFASGEGQKALLEALDYKDEIKITQGVGIINKPLFEKIDKTYQKRFLFIGRLAAVKNLKMLIKIFNALPEYQLTIVGTGELYAILKKLAHQNIKFIDGIDNKKLPTFFQNNDVFILPSINEPWGLVIEEALYFGLPVIVSKNCGVIELIKHGVNGYIIDPIDTNDIRETIMGIDKKSYLKLISGVENFSIKDKDKRQINTYQ